VKWANGLPFFPDFCDEMGKAQMRSNDAEKTLWSRFGTPFASFYHFLSGDPMIGWLKIAPKNVVAICLTLHKS
jgi:hypothetical protein